MKRLLPASIILIAAQMPAQTNTFPSSGNVGIGTTEPQASVKLDVRQSGANSFGVASYVYDGSGTSVALYGLGYAVSGSGSAYGVQGLSTYPRGTGTNIGGYFSASGAANNYALLTGSGNVGIGTTNPLAAFQVTAAPAREIQIGVTAGAFSTSSHFSDLSTLGSVINLSRPSDGAFAHSIFSYAATDGGHNLGIAARSDIKFVVGAISDRGLIIKDSGNVGIGTTIPEQKLQVSGGRLRVNTGAAWDNIDLHTDGEHGYLEANGDEQGLWLLSNTGQKVIVPTANVGIGTTNPTHKLAVNGTIKAKEVIVETTGWSDYVFADDYRLAPLAEVEAHIKEHKHLPGIPSAAEVSEQGVSVGDMQAKLLAKIEELTLHQIALEKRVAEQSQEISKLKARF
jgi:hypothetical protein